jgi:hypothetical protein
MVDLGNKIDDILEINDDLNEKHKLLEADYIQMKNALNNALSNTLQPAIPKRNITIRKK